MKAWFVMAWFIIAVAVYYTFVLLYPNGIY